MTPAVTQMDLAAEGILYEFEGAPVKGVGVEVRNAAGGLNDAMKVQPVVHHGGDTVFVVMRCDVVAIDHRPIKGDEGAWRRVEVLRATDATTMEHGAITKAIDQQRAQIQKWRDEQEQKQAMFPDERL